VTDDERRRDVAGPVLDSFALLVFLFKEKGHQKLVDVFDAATDDDQTTLIAAPNWAEVRYIVERKVGMERWSEVRPTILALPLQVVVADQSLAEAAGALKAAKKMSLADCFAAALAQQERSPVYTGDPEFKAVEKEVEVVWL
jgi:predicted nucleic acid-binding protein